MSLVIVKGIIDEEECRFGEIGRVSFHQRVMIEFCGIFTVVLINNEISEAQNLVSQLAQTLGPQHYGQYITMLL